ncbi:hypothetical protein LCGC14_1330120, partial [marine sediment metagenome]
MEPGVVVGEVPTAINYEAMSLDEVLAAVGKAWEIKDLRLMARLSKLHGKKETELQARLHKDMLAALVEVTGKTLADFTALVDRLVESGQLDGA